MCPCLLRKQQLRSRLQAGTPAAVLAQLTQYLISISLVAWIFAIISGVLRP